MNGTRVPFDPSLPFIVATEDLPYGPHRFVRGDAFPWQQLKVTDFDLLQLWGGLKVDCVAPPAPPAPPADLVLEMPGLADAPAAEKLTDRDLAARSKSASKRRG